MPLSKVAQERIREKARNWLGRVKTEVAKDKAEDKLRVASAAAYDSADYITSLVAANKAQKILNRVRAAIGEGQVDASALDVQKVRSIAGEALSNGEAGAVLQTVLRGAYNAARFEYQQEDETRPFLIYRTMRDKRVRLEHRPLEGLMLPASDAAWSTLYPPNGYGCRCRVDSLTPAQAEQLQRTSKRVHKTPPADLAKHITDGFNSTPNNRAGELAKLLGDKMRDLSNA